ncbi:MAG: bifunctional YncE family protein/alkaline phosphatase family protein [Actinobacteria bacterium]|nr:bifunctional YncE family protein/alkaline phosphatase family protein [Actinomycetota bacterium]
MVVAFFAVVGVAGAALTGWSPFGTEEVGQIVNGAVLLPTNQWISPIGNRIEDPKAKIESSTLSPDGNYMAALTWHEFTGYLTIFDLKTGKIIQEEGNAYPNGTLDPAAGEPGEQVAADGPFYSPDGKTLWVPQTGDIAKFTVDPTTGMVSDKTIITMPKAANAEPPEYSTEAKHPGEALPSGMAFSADASKLYVALNGSNSLAVINTATDAIEREIPVGIAPRQVVVDGNTAYVSNEGGRPPQPGETTNLTDGTAVVSSPVTGAATTGTVSVVNLQSDQQEGEIEVGLQPTALYRDGSALFVANSNDDSLSLIDTQTDKVVQTVSTNPLPGAKVGSYANAISMPDPNHLLVSIGRDNAIAVYGFKGLTKKVGGGHHYGWRHQHGGHEIPVKDPLGYEGLLPTDWYPVEVQPDPALGAGQIVVTNARGIGDRGPQAKICKGPETSPATECATGFNTYDETGTVTTFKLPSGGELAQDTKTVFADNDWKNVPAINSGAGDTVPHVIPPQIGGHSPIKHVFVIVKENRTYDQVLGDLGEGNGDPELAQFGEKVTPNQHALAKRFGDLDNFYDEGTLSADGHNWIVQAEANDYIEKEFGAFYRSYPAEGNDALAYQRDGFLWNAAEKAGLSVKDFGEYNYFLTTTGKGTGGTWKEWYEDSQILEGKQSGPLPIPTGEYKTTSDIPSLNEITDHAYPRFDLEIPDQYRYDIWKEEFEREEASNSVPNLTLIWLPDDHTGGAPKPVAQAADNDLAMGKIVEAISHSKVWGESAIFGVEDDTQNGVDHVDGHRGPAFVISPYSKGGVDHEYASQPSMVRTVEQILGITPMNQVDYAAEPMYGAFTETPNFAPYTALPNQIPLTLGVPGFQTPGAAVPQSMRHVYKAWQQWKARQGFQGMDGRPDSANPLELDRYDWYSAHGWTRAYPGDPKVYGPEEVPGHKLPAAVVGD